MSGRKRIIIDAPQRDPSPQQIETPKIAEPCNIQEVTEPQLVQQPAQGTETMKTYKEMKQRLQLN